MTISNENIPAAPFAQALAGTERFIGLVNAEALQAVSDGILTPSERQRLIIRLRGVEAEILTLISKLER